MKYKIEILKPISLIGATMKPGEIQTIETSEPINFNSPTFNGVTVTLKNYKYRKFFWWDEFRIVETLDKA